MWQGLECEAVRCRGRGCVHGQRAGLSDGEAKLWLEGSGLGWGVGLPVEGQSLRQREGLWMEGWGLG